MSRSKNSRKDREAAIADAEKLMNAARRAERQAHERAERTGSPVAKREFIAKAGLAQRAEDRYLRMTRIRDTGWTALPTSHGTRYHRERGETLQLDVEMQVTTWICSATSGGVLARTSRNHATAGEAKAFIETAFGVPELPLPEGGAE